MVTFLDVGLTNAFGSVFAFIFVWVITYALLHKFKFLGDSVALNGVLAVAVAFISIISDIFVDVINTMIPYFAIAIIFFILLLILFQIFGAKEEHIRTTMQNDKAIVWTIIGVGMAIFAISLGQVLGQQFTDVSFQDSDTPVVDDGSVASADFEKNIFSTFTNPKVLGLIIMFVIGIFAIALLSAESIPKGKS
ncbi:hypothetical protein HOI26_02615 [Candidatus Woesearchaeota archaeon]|jgi:hypothetical protein|nr:hypothetical protein [Candidatus Woesearchaeota archaeon]MBT5739970.1 hypothetical protein [Candidatus Woesearchaeota archaeon]